MTAKVISIIGGTGAQGKGLGYRLARAGHRVVIGSRSAERAEAAAAAIRDRLPAGGSVSGDTNEAAAAAGSLLILAVPYAGHAELVKSLAEHLAGKVVISCVNPLGFDRHGPFGLEVPAGSAAEELQGIVPGSSVVGAFHHLSAVTLWGDREDISDEDVLVIGDDEEARSLVAELCRDITGRTGVHAGRLRLARQLEPLTAALISVNKRYRVHAGVRISGLPTAGSDDRAQTA